MKYELKEVVLRTKNRWNDAVVDLPENVKMVKTEFEAVNQTTKLAKRFGSISELRELMDEHGNNFDFKEMLLYLEPVEETANEKD